MIRHLLILEVLLFQLKNLKDRINNKYNHKNMNKKIYQMIAIKMMKYMNKKLSIIKMNKFKQKNKK